MNCIRATVCAAIFFVTSVALAQDSRLAGLGQFVIAGRGADAREQLVKARDQLHR